MIFVPVASPSTSVSTTFGGVFDVAASEQRLAAIETELSRPNAWDNPEALTPLLREKRQLEDEVSRLNALKTCHDDMHEWLELAVESGEDEALESLAADLLSGRRERKDTVRDEMLHTVACKAAIKAGWDSDPKELMVLAEQVMTREDLKYCPHGRPICISLSKKQLEKQFKRS